MAFCLGLKTTLGPQDSWWLDTESRKPQVQDNGSAATAMLRLAGFVLLAVSEYVGELEQAIETTAAVAFCRRCGAQVRLHDRRPSCRGTCPRAAGR